MKNKDLKKQPFINEIEKLDKLRNITRKIYMDGAYSASDLAKLPDLNIKERALRDFIKRLDHYTNRDTNSDILSYHNIPGRTQDRKAHYFRLDFTVQNPLSELYFQHTLNKEHLSMYLYLLLTISLSKTSLDDNDLCIKGQSSEQSSIRDFFPTPNIIEGMSEQSIISLLNDMFNFNCLSLIDESSEVFTKSVFADSDDNHFSSAKVNRFLSELTDLGILIKEIENSDDYFDQARFHYRLPELFEWLYPDEDDKYRLNNAMIVQLKNLISFYTHYSLISFPGFSLNRKLEYLIKESTPKSQDTHYNTAYNYRSPIVACETRYQNILDDEVVGTLITAIAEMKPIRYHYLTDNETSFSHKAHNNQLDEPNTAFLPVKIVDVRYGRHYVFGWKYKSHTLKNTVHGEWICHRIDRINAIEIVTYKKKEKQPDVLAFISKQKPNVMNSPKDQRDYLNSKYEEYIKYAWKIESNPKSKTKSVLIHFCFKDHPEYFKYLEHTRGNGTIVCIDKEQSKYDYFVETYSVTEMIPWINRFGDTATIDHTINPDFYDIYKDYTQEVLNLYEPIQ